MEYRKYPLGLYRLDENRQAVPVPESDILAWAIWMGQGDRIVARSVIGESTVSTVFLGTDHAFGHGPPILWETMVFGGPLEQEQTRCRGTIEQAEAMHEKMVERVKEELKPENVPPSE